MVRLLWFVVVFAAIGFAQPNYTRDIAPIFQARCQQCHREGDIAPFALDNYDTAKDWSEDIKRAINDGTMPPWKPVPGYGEFRGTRSLTDDEKNLINSWIDGGLVRGDDADLPPPIEAKGDWINGDPDLIVQMPEAYTPPRIKDVYRCFVLPTEFDETRWVNAIDILPGDRRSVHHVILYLDTSGQAEKLDADEDGAGYTCYGGPKTPIDFTDLLSGSITLGGWAPGTRPQPLPEGIAMELPPHARIVMQVHYYTRSGQRPDQTRVGLYFSKEKVTKKLRYIPVLPLDTHLKIDLTIPANNDSYEAKSTYLIPPLFDSHIVNVFPHMHLLGTKIKLDLLPLSGDPKPLIYIDQWDFNWQGPYTFVEPIAAPSFNRLQLTCTYNNSESNPRNPNSPIKTVSWGEGTEDEMCLGFVGLTFDRERLQ